MHKNDYNPFMIDDGYYWFKFSDGRLEVVKIVDGKMFRFGQSGFGIISRQYGKIIKRVKEPKE